MKKIIILIGVLFLFSGCKATYELEIVDNNYNEKVTFSDLIINEGTNKLLDYNIPIYINYELKNDISSLKEDGFDYYQKGKYSFYHQFNMKDYYRSFLANTVYDQFLVNYDYREENEKEDLILISTGYTTSIFEEAKGLEEIKVKIKTNHKVFYNDANLVEDDIYTWYLKPDNKTQTINLVLYKDKYVSNYNSSLTKKIFLIIGIILVISTTGIIIYKKRN